MQQRRAAAAERKKLLDGKPNQHELQQMLGSIYVDVKNLRSGGDGGQLGIARPCRPMWGSLSDLVQKVQCSAKEAGAAEGSNRGNGGWRGEESVAF